MCGFPTANLFPYTAAEFYITELPSFVGAKFHFNALLSLQTICYYLCCRWVYRLWGLSWIESVWFVLLLTAVWWYSSAPSADLLVSGEKTNLENKNTSLRHNFKQWGYQTIYGTLRALKISLHLTPGLAQNIYVFNVDHEQTERPFRLRHFCAITRRVVAIPFRSFLLDSWPLKMGPIGCPGTSVRNYCYTLRNSPEECSSHLLRGRSPKSGKERLVRYTVMTD